MTNYERQDLLTEIYRLAPELKEHEEELKQLIAEMAVFRPEIKLDSNFVNELKQKLLYSQHNQAVATSLNDQKNQNNLKINSLLFNLMNKKIYLAVASLAVLVLALVAVTTALRKDVPGAEKIFALLPKEEQAEISQLSAGAFGDLAGLNPATDGAAAGRGSAQGLGGDAILPMSTDSDLATESGSLLEESEKIGDGGMAGAEPDIALDARIMPYPYYGVSYRYRGEDLNLNEERADVYRRLKGDGQMAKSLNGLLNNLSLPLINIKAFNQIGLSNLSFTENRDQGLMVSIDFNEDQIYISENWEKWRIAERDNCGNDPACWERFRLKPSDVPADEELIAWADDFLSKYGISREHYGVGRVIDNHWREIYASTNDLNQVYIPEYATVAYPLLLNGQEVHDQSGVYSGLRVNINLLKKAPSGLYGLTPYRYESSSYELETDAAKIIAAAEKGGWNRGFWGGNENLQTLELDTPEKVYVQFWRYNKDSGKSDELLVPALAFPILNKPSTMYYSPKVITVPLVKEMLEELNQQTNGPVLIEENLGEVRIEEVIMKENLDKVKIEKSLSQ